MKETLIYAYQSKMLILISKESMEVNMVPQPDNKKIENEKEANYTKIISELKTLIKEKTKLEETYLNQLRYARADLENLQKHIQKRIDEGVTMEKVKLITQLLPVVDDVDLTLDEAKKTRNSSLLEGIEMIRKKLWKALSCEGVCPIETIGKPFDPHIHEATQEVKTCDYPDGTIVQEVRKGYLLNGNVLKPSLVKVARSPDSVKVE